MNGKTKRSGKSCGCNALGRRWTKKESVAGHDRPVTFALQRMLGHALYGPILDALPRFFCCCFLVARSVSS